MVIFQNLYLCYRCHSFVDCKPIIIGNWDKLWKCKVLHSELSTLASCNQEDSLLQSGRFLKLHIIQWKKNSRIGKIVKFVYPDWFIFPENQEVFCRIRKGWQLCTFVHLFLLSMQVFAYFWTCSSFKNLVKQLNTATEFLKII